MPSIPSHQARAKRVDRFMAFAISSGGLTIIGAVLAMLLFIMKESVPLFLPPQSKSLGTLQTGPAGGAWADESGKAIVLMSRTEGVRALRFPEGSALPAPDDGPALPWRSCTPLNSKGEALVAARGFRATGRKELPDPADGACPLLRRETGRCLIYAERPFGCRTHFCAAAGGPYPRRQVLDLIRRLEELDRRLGGDGPRAIQAAVTDALDELV